MKNKILPLINNCILSIFILISVSGCRIYWFDDFKGTFNDNFGIEYKYYIDESSESFISQKYVLGSILSSKDLLASSSKEVKNLNPGFILIGWKIKEYHNNSYYSSEPEYTLNDEDFVIGINVNYTSYDFYGVWEPSTDTPYIVKYLFETITEDGFDFEEDAKFIKKKKGTTLEQTAAEPIEVEGYECEEIEQQIIKGDGSTVVEVKLHRKDSIFKYKGYKISYYDYLEKSFTGDLNTFSDDDYVILENETKQLTIPEFNLSLVDGNEIVFDGWYTDSECSPSNKITSLDGSSLSEDISLYAKWNYKYVYLDPANYYKKASNNNNGASASNPVLSVEEAKKYLNNTNSDSIIVMSTINTVADISNLSGITTAQNNNAIVKRYSLLLDKPLISLSSNEVTLDNVTIDGGAEWTDYGEINGAIGAGLSTNGYGYQGDFKDCVAPLILLNGGKLTLSDNTIVQNNYNSSSIDGGGGVSITSNLSKLSLISDTAKIYNNCVPKVSGGGVYISSGELSITKGIIDHNLGKIGGGIGIVKEGILLIQGETKSDVLITNNRAVNSSGGGICVSGESTSKGKLSVVINNASILNNISANNTMLSAYGQNGSGGALYLYYLDDSTISNTLISGNKSAKYGGAVVCGNNSKVRFIDCEITNNEILNMDGIGAGFSLSSSNTTFEGNTSVHGNIYTDGITKSFGKGIAINASAQLTIKDSTTFGHDDDVYIELSSKSGCLNIDVSKADESQSLATIKPSVYPDAATQEYQIIKFIDDGYSTWTDLQKNTIASNLNVIQPESSIFNYFINERGMLVSDAYYDSGDIIIPDYSNIIFSADSNSFVNDKINEILISAKLNEAIITENIEDWKLALLSGSVDVTEIANIIVENNKISLPKDLDPGVYIIVVKGSYNHVEYNSSIYVTVEQGQSSSGNNGALTGHAAIPNYDKLPVTQSVAVIQDFSEFNDSTNSFSNYLASIQEDSFTLEFKNITSEQLNNSLSSALHSCSGKSVVLDFYDADKSLFPESTTCLLSSVSCVKGLILPKNTEKVPALADFKSLETVIIPETVTDISTSAFARCNSLKNFCFADSSNIIEIPSYMFQGCEALETITIPASIKKIGSQVFQDCTNLKEVVFKNPTGWTWAYSEGAEGEDVDVSDPQLNATKFLDTATCAKIWSRR